MPLSLVFLLEIIFFYTSTTTKDKQVCNLTPLPGHTCFGFGYAFYGGKHYYYDKTTKTCEEFTYNGCGGSDNRFDSKKDCMKLCNPPKPKIDCQSKPNEGIKCGSRGRLPGARIYYDASENRCRQFDYLGCGGNNNNYDNYLQCEHTCNKKKVHQLVTYSPCHQSLDKGSSSCGKSSELRYYFDKTTLKCRQFEYRGCGGNENQFKYMSHCNQKCGVRNPGLSKKERLQRFKARTRYICNMRQDRGEYCKTTQGSTMVRSHKRFVWNSGLRTCEIFYWKGCGGNDNRFKSHTECRDFCQGF